MTLFERTHLPPVVSVCEGRYVIAEAKPGDVIAAAPRRIARRAGVTRAVSLERCKGAAS